MTRRRSRGCLSICFSTPTAAPPPQITLDLDATDDPLHGHQEERFFHGYYDNYCYLPLYVFCGRHLLAAKLRPANIDASAGSIEEVARIVAQIRAALAQGAHPVACRFGLCPRGADGVVREQRRRFPVRPGQERAPRRRDRDRTRRGARAEPTHRQAGAPLQGLHLADAQELEPRASGRRQGGMDRAAKPIRALSSPRWRARSTRPATSTRSSTAPAARWKTASRNASSTFMPTAPRPTRCAPTSCGCGSPRWPMS